MIHTSLKRQPKEIVSFAGASGLYGPLASGTMSRSLAVFLLLLAPLLAVRAEDETPAIRDDAKLFSPAAIAHAEESIRAIQRTNHFDVIIETTSEPGPEISERLNRSNNPDRTFGEVTQERARRRDIHGAYIYICSNPSHRLVAVVVQPEEYRTAFTDRHREYLRRQLASKLKKPDDALARAIDFLHADVKPVKPANEPDESWWPTWATVVAIAGGVLVLWVAIGLTRMRRPAAPPAVPVDSTNSRFVPGLLGGMFGSVAGHWIYDRFFHAELAGKETSPGEPLP